VILEERIFDESDRLAKEIDGILKQGPPETVLKDDSVAMRFSDILDNLSEERALDRLADISGMTPDWSLFIRNYLELSHDRFDLEFDADGGEPSEDSHDSQDAVFGIGLLIDTDRPLPESVSLEKLFPLAGVLESALSDSGHSVQVFLHPRILSLADLYTFSYDSRRGFIEERLEHGFSMKPEKGGLPVMVSDLFLGDWDQPSASLLPGNDPVLRFFEGSLENGRGTIVGVVRISPPYPGEWGDVLDERFSAVLQERVGKVMGQMIDASTPFSDPESEVGEGQVSIMPWSILFPMGVTVAMGSFLAEGLETGSIHPERVGMTPVWRDGSLWIEIDGTPLSGPLKFLAVDEYVGHFMESYVPQIMESMMGLSVRWNKRKGGERAISLGVV
jgi:hypothetical protein